MVNGAFSGSQSRVLIAVIAYNEARNLPSVIGELRTYCTHDLVVIDNGSTDATIEVCRNLRVPYVAHCVNTGGGMGTVKTYFRYAEANGYSVLCQFDGDGQHVAAQLETIIAPIIERRADYVIGSRFIRRTGFQSTGLRRVGINLFSWTATRLIGQEITDVTSGFRAYGRPVIELFARRYKHEIYDTSQLLLLAHYAGARILEVPVEMRPRRSGASEYTPLRASLFPFVAALNIVGCWMQRKSMEQVRRIERGD
jgi:glycosyltransferase involved in cell wall biosynthesis